MDGCEFECAFFIFVSLLPSLLLKWVPLLLAIAWSLWLAFHARPDEGEAGIMVKHGTVTLTIAALIAAVAWAMYWEV
jgi:hypothetical protein